jgi:dolichol-phosphate mannosyltransferase
LTNNNLKARGISGSSEVLSVVIPVYNNADSLVSLFHELRKPREELNQLGLSLQLIFVDDGSTDSSLTHLVRFQLEDPSVTVVKHTRNFGAIAASKTGLGFIRGNCFTILAADLQDPPDLIPQMALLWRRGAKYVICERISRDDPLMSRVFSAIYYHIVRKQILPGYPRGGFDLALLDSSLLQYILASGKNVPFPLLGYWLGFAPQVLKYERRARLGGSSGWTFKKKWKYFLDAIYGFSNLPIKLAAVTGGATAVGAFLYGMYVVVNAFLNKIPVEGFATLVGLFSFLLGMILMVLGIMGGYLWRILDEVSSRPEAIVENVWSK